MIKNVKKLFIRALLLLLVISIIPISFAQAADFSAASIQLSRLAENVSPGPILIQAKTGVADTEDAVQVIVGSAWSIDTSASAFSVSTANLPTGIIAWPGINTASQVTGQTIIFPSNDLTPGITYGFYITGGLLTNPTAGNNPQHLWQMKTQVSGSDSSIVEIAIPTIVNDQISVTASVAADPNSLQLAFSEDQGITSVQENQTLSYTLTYGSTLPYSSAVTLRASWSTGTLSDSSQNGIPIVSYVSNSATDAYNSTAPVIDLTNRTITWSIVALPNNTTNQTVQFQLKTTSAYTGSLGVNFSTTGEIVSPTNKSTSIQHTYNYSTPVISATPTPTHTITPTNTTTPSNTSIAATATPQQSVQLFPCDQSCTESSGCETQFCDPALRRCRLKTNPSSTQCQPSTLSLVAIHPTQLRSDAATFDVQLSSEAFLQLYLGTSTSSTKLYQTLPATTFHHLALTELTPETQYFFSFIAQSSDGNTYQSEVFSFTTTAKSHNVSLPDQILFSSTGILIASGNTSSTPLFHLPTNLPVETTLLFPDNSFIASIVIHGSSQSNQSLFLGKLSASTSQAYSSNLILPPSTGIYELFARIQNIYGSFEELRIANLKLITPLTITDATSHKPIERAEIFVKKKHPVTNVYEPFSNLSVNPVFSNHIGQTMLYLGDGEYQIEVSASGYKKQELSFVIQSDSLSQYPQVELIPSSIISFDTVWYHTTSLKIIGERLTQLLDTLAQSPATVQVIGFSSLTIFSILSTLSLLSKTHVTWKGIKAAWEFHKKFHFPSLYPQHFFTFGKVIDATTGKSIPVSEIVITNQKTGITIWTGKTDHIGIFKFSTNKKVPIHLTITAPGYLPLEKVVVPQEQKAIAYNFKLEKQQKMLPTMRRQALFFIKQLSGRLFELFLILSFVTELVAFQYFPTTEVLPFFSLSTVNLGLWLQHGYSAYLHSTHLTQ